MSKYKLYTKTGDDGTTGLFSGKRVSKHHVRIKAYGTIDELNAWIGLIRNDEIAAETNSFLIRIQKELMVIASQLADDTSEKTRKLRGKIVPITFKNVTEIESEIDKINNELPELKNFIIPGGHFLISYTHLARCTCRRAERFITELKDDEEVSSVIIAYINRLSDYLFILARKLSKDFDVEEIKWIAKKNN